MSKVLRKCKDCGLEALSIEELPLFKHNKASKFKRENLCKKCGILQSSEWRNNNRELNNNTARQRSRTNKIKGLLLKGGMCEHCGVVYDKTNATIFDFHHLDPSIKESELGVVVNCSFKKFVSELEKCILLCSNCHRLEHNDKY